MGQEYLTSEQKAFIRKKIDKLLDRTREKIRQMEDMTQPVTPENSIGRISRMDAINNKSVMEAALRTARAELDALEYADRHLDESVYGDCIECANKIDVKRLMVMPGSRRCMVCAR